MKAVRKLLGELLAWRWAPAVGLCVASLFYVLLVVALVPNEIGVPVTNAHFAQKLAPAPAETPEAPTFPTAAPEPEQATPVAAPAPVQPAGVVDFGRRGFSPPIDRPEAPPPPMLPPPVAVPPPPPEAPVAVAPTPEAPADGAAAGVATPPPAPDQGAAPPPVAAAPVPPTPTGNILRSMRAFKGQGIFPAFPPGGTPPGAAPAPPQPPPQPAPPQ
jgi:hypothetical protein